MIKSKNNLFEFGIRPSGTWWFNPRKDLNNVYGINLYEYMSDFIEIMNSTIFYHNFNVLTGEYERDVKLFKDELNESTMFLLEKYKDIRKRIDEFESNNAQLEPTDKSVRVFEEILYSKDELKLDQKETTNFKKLLIPIITHFRQLKDFEKL